MSAFISMGSLPFKITCGNVTGSNLQSALSASGVLLPFSPFGGLVVVVVEEDEEEEVAADVISSDDPL